MNSIVFTMYGALIALCGGLIFIGMNNIFMNSFGLSIVVSDLRQSRRLTQDS